MEYHCEITGVEIGPDDVIQTAQGGEIRREANLAGDDLVKLQARIDEVNDWIILQKSIESTRLQNEYGTLKTEIEKGVYSGMSDQDIIAYLSNPANGTPEDDPVISSDDFKGAMDSVEFLALTMDQKAALSVYTAGGSIDLSNNNIKDTLDTIYPSISKSRIAIEALRPQPKTISENLGFFVPKQEYIERARLIQ